MAVDRAGGGEAEGGVGRWGGGGGQRAPVGSAQPPGHVRWGPVPVGASGAEGVCLRTVTPRG